MLDGNIGWVGFDGEFLLEGSFGGFGCGNDEMVGIELDYCDGIGL